MARRHRPRARQHGRCAGRAFPTPATAHRLEPQPRDDHRGRGVRGSDLIVACVLRLRRDARGADGAGRRRPSWSARRSSSSRAAARRCPQPRRVGARRCRPLPRRLDRQYPARIGDGPRSSSTRATATAYDLHSATLVALGGRPTFVGETRPRRGCRPGVAVVPVRQRCSACFRAPRSCEAEGADAAAVFDAVPSFGIEIAAEAHYARGLIRRQGLPRRPGDARRHLAGDGAHPRRGGREPASATPCRAWCATSPRRRWPRAAAARRSRRSSRCCGRDESPTPGGGARDDEPGEVRGEPHRCGNCTPSPCSSPAHDLAAPFRRRRGRTRARRPVRVARGEVRSVSAGADRPISTSPRRGTRRPPARRRARATTAGRATRR